jgi:peptide chain release factor 2
MEKLSSLLKKIQATMALLKIEELKVKAGGLLSQMNQPDFWQEQKIAAAISEDYESIRQEVEKWENLENQTKDLMILAETADEEMNEEIATQTDRLIQEFTDYEFVLLLNGPYDKSNAIVAIHAGSGGTEAQDWSAMLLRMVLRYAEKMKWQTKIIDESLGQEAGYKSVMFEVKGRFAYGYLKSEHGVHRLVRISPFDAEKMRHTSFALIEVLPEVSEDIDIKIDPKDLRIDTFQSGGAGGQSVNTTYSAIRIVHIPTNISVSCQNERSQAQNKETAMKILKAKLYRLEQEKKAAEKKELRGEYKSAEWSNQIRSYVLHPYHLVKDHRTDYEESDPDQVLDGELKNFSEEYLKWIKK